LAPDNQALVTSLAASHGDQLHRFLLARVRNPADVPDIAQEVYLRLLRVSTAESIRSPEAYLFTVAQHVVQQHALRQLAIPPAEDLSQMPDLAGTGSEHDPSLQAAAQQFAEKLQGTLDRLTPKARAAFILHRRDGMTPDEIAAHLGISRPMVKKYLLKALMRLRVHLESTDPE
jgi:RNA polymerase sigma factor (sigma-70 family)